MKTLLGLATLAMITSAASVQAAVPQISPEDAYRLASQGEATLIDVRERDEIAEGMVQGATWLPLSEIKNQDPHADQVIAGLDKDREALTYCHSGRRAEVVAMHLEGMGFRVRNAGAFSAFEEAGIPTIKP